MSVGLGIFITLSGLLVFVVYLAIQRHRYRNRIYAKIIGKDNNVHKIDITDHAQWFEYKTGGYRIDKSAVVTEGKLINKKAIYYLEGYSNPLKFPEDSEVKTSSELLKELEDYELNEAEDTNDTPIIPRELLINPYELHDLLKVRFGEEIFSTRRKEGFNFERKHLILLLIVISAVVVLAVFWGDISEALGLASGGGGEAPPTDNWGR